MTNKELQVENITEAEKYSFLKNIKNKLKEKSGMLSTGMKAVLSGVEGFVSAGPIGAAIMAAVKVAEGALEKSSESEIVRDM